MRRIKRHLSYANVAATLALIIAVAGGTTAIAGSKAPKNSVASSSIKPFNVTAANLAGIRVVQVSMASSMRLPMRRDEERLIGGGAEAQRERRLSALRARATTVGTSNRRWT